MGGVGPEIFLGFGMGAGGGGFAAGSPPPVRAANSTFLMRLANSLPRLASTPAFLCLVVAHLEWPLMRCPSQSLRIADGCAGPWSVRGGRPWRAVALAGRRRSYRCPGRFPEC